MAFDIHYENRAVLFLDILNFKNIIAGTLNSDGTENEEKTQCVYDVLSIIRDTLQIGIPEDNTTKRITQFSDSIVISFAITERGKISSLILDIHFLIKRLAMKQILCRGGIAYGKLIHDEKFVFGPGLITAYYAESKAAIYPRVILDKTILQYAGIYNDNPYNSPEWEVGGIFTVVSKDSDEMFYIDYIEKEEWGSKIEGVSRQDYVSNLKTIIERGIKSTQPDIKVKYGWMQNKYNRLVDTWKKRCEPSSILKQEPEWKEFVSRLEKII